MLNVRWLAGWLDKLKIKLTSALVEVEIEDELRLSLAISYFIHKSLKIKQNLTFSIRNQSVNSFSKSLIFPGTCAVPEFELENVEETTLVSNYYYKAGDQVIDKNYSDENH